MTIPIRNTCQAALRLGLTSLVLPPLLLAQAVEVPDETIAPDGLQADDQFGSSLVVDGRDMVVLALAERPPGASVAGTLRFYRLRGGRWREAGFFAPAVVLSPFNFFGRALELSEGWGAASHAGTIQNIGAPTYLFRRHGDHWTYVGDLDVSRIENVIGGPNNTGGGTAGAIRGDRMIVQGQSYALLYELSSGTWTPVGEVHPPTIPPGDPGYRFSGRLAFDGERLVSNLLFLNGSQGIRTNGAFQWLPSGTGYVPGPQIDFPAGSLNGSNWQISDRWLVNAFVRFPGTGYASIFERDPLTDRWTYHSRVESPQPGFNPVERTDNFGITPFAMEGNRILIGAESHIRPGGTTSELSGAAFLYEYDAQTDRWDCTRWFSTEYADQAGQGINFFIGRGVGLFTGGAVVSDSIAQTGGVRTGAVHVYYDEIASTGCAGSDPPPGASAEVDVFGCNDSDDPSLGFRGQIEPGAPYLVLGSRTGGAVQVPGLGGTPLCLAGPRVPLGAVGTAAPDGSFEAGVDAGTAPLLGLLPGDSVHFQVLYRTQATPGRLAVTESRVVTFE